ncbi:MAG: fatty acid desaturase [Pseudomonadota bacterium]
MTPARELFSASRAFARSDNRRAWIELSATLALYFVAMFVGLASLGTWWLVVPTVIVASAMGLRIYMIQHDCLHRSFFSSRNQNDLVGKLVSPIAMTPYEATRYIHGQHHTYVSDLERRDTFEIYTMTLNEWRAASAFAQLKYRFYRSPIVLIIVGPFLLYAVLRRAPLYAFRHGFKDLIQHNLLLAAFVGAVYMFAGWPGILFWLTTVFLACMTGSLIPYVVHNFEEINWGRRPELTFEHAALSGSAVLNWGRLFDLVTLNIGYHDLHHLNAKIPGYHLREAHKSLEDQELIDSVKIGFFEGLACLRWKLYDEENECMIPFPSLSADRQTRADLPAE